MNILPDISRGGAGGNTEHLWGNMSGWQFQPKKGPIFIPFTKNAILDKFLKLKNMGKFFKFFCWLGKNRFFWQNIHLCKFAKKFML